jgi:hypothetical protein
MTSVITGFIGIGLLVTFLGFMLVWVPAPPLIIIMVGVTLLLVWDFVQTIRHGDSNWR